MIRRMLPLVVALVLGCKNNPEGAGGNDGKVDSDPDVAHILKLREPQEWDKVEVTLLESGFTELTSRGKTTKRHLDGHQTYTDTFLADSPPKLTRAYSKLGKYDPDTRAVKSLPNEGKTVTIQKGRGGKAGSAYRFSWDGQMFSAGDEFGLFLEFSQPHSWNIRDLLPNGAVKVNEPWSLTRDWAEQYMGWIPFAFGAPRGECVGRLTRAYTKDGKQWGTLTFSFNYEYPPGDAIVGSVKLDGTLDAVIDGTAHDRCLTVRMGGEISGGALVSKFVIQAEHTKTLKSVK
jgi:hypothetical protein